MRIGIILLLLCLVVPEARADDKAAAESAFVRGKRLMKEGKTQEACDAFSTSQRLDPQIGTQYNLAICYQDLGRLASAWVLFREVAQRDSNAARKKDSSKRADAIEPRLSKLMIIAPATTGLKVTRDGVDVTNLVGVEDPVDPGKYRIEASAGEKEFRREVEVKGEGVVVKVMVELDAGGTGGPATGGDAAGGPVVDDDEEEEIDTGGGGSKRKIIGISTAAVGGVAIGVGLFFGTQASASLQKAKDACGGDLVCATDADRMISQGHVDDARKKGNLSTLFVGAGVVAATAGVILWLTAPSGHEAGDEGGDETALRFAPSLGPDGIGLVAAGVF